MESPTIAPPESLADAPTKGNAPTKAQIKQSMFIKCLNGFELENKIESLEQLDDGIVFSEILRDLDPEISLPTLTKPAVKWVDKTANLEAVFKALDKYLYGMPDLEWLARSYDPRKIARNFEDVNGLCEVAAVIIYASVKGPHVGRLVPAMRANMSETESALLMQTLEAKDKENRVMASSNKAAAAPKKSLDTTDSTRDLELQMEEDRARMLMLQKQNADLNTRLDHAQLACEDLKDRNAALLGELDDARKSQSGNADARIKYLENHIRELDELIATQEMTISEDKEALARCRNEIAQLSKTAEKAQSLEDEVKVLTNENAELSKKANVAARYKDKLERLKHSEKDIETLNYVISGLEDKVKILEKEQLRAEAQEKIIGNYREWQQRHETDLNDMREQKNMLADQLAHRTQELQRLLDQRALDESLINELREQIAGNGDVPLSPSPEPGAQRDESQHEVAALKLEIQKIKAENNLLRNNMGIASATDQLRAELEASKRNEARLTDKLHEVRKDYAVAQDQLQGLLNNTTDEGSQLFRDLQRTMFQSRQDRDKAQEQSRKLEAEVKDRDRELLALKTDYKVATQSSVDALEELKKTDQLISNSLRDELDSLRTAFDSLKLDTQEQQKQLIEALVSREKLRKELEDANNGAQQTAAEGLAGLDRDASNELMQKQAEKLEKLKEKCQSLLAQLQKNEQERYELQRRLKAAEGGEAYASLKAATDQIIKNLQRENAMISTAWYDLTSRLQSNHVVLQRRQDMPKSWLNKQRQMVNATPRR
ncbi:hypothetical protein MCOR07_004015 [Pyricularia oryzae]|uniref:Calponin-homology (CH) domain-containing protein n=1 Tax=Pyricularia oryzae (strain 70-15 / ATCC MYA-4617 / FGSC 8958) TaxID=242507 RepID=G4NCJ5_PYRO7|nr:uncharacterized protein MGG_01063 [Pyricularia oryzae 70-15]KAH8840269.1 hypothetical protein MCOR01_006988 [Pyricularia oryzae]EHA48292.1 hypothetical protein MGG_01063 [Pyricularia oryzae 70-15]KAI6279994.1 hypothetical protein MCOR26_003961 [Pyricularia oryzae]KAI6322793.1 hypothetical protein MCOR30_007545 [Pyricularia oryzae]KAI6328525.1 hypothetical protein MCOR29_002663 [Pyricularia oryzae]